MTISDDPTIVILALESVVYLLAPAIILKRSGLQGRARRAMILYAAVSSLWMLDQVIWRLDWLDALKADLPERIPLYGVFVLSWLFLHLSRAFLRLEETDRRWWWLGLAWLAFLVIFDADVLRLAEVWWRSNGWVLRRTRIGMGALVAGWGLYMFVAALLTTRAFRRARQPLHRNRLTYWWPVLMLTLAGGALSLAKIEPLGSGLCLLGALIGAYAVITHNLPDVRQAARRAANYLFITLLTVAIYTAGFATMQYFFEASPGYSPLLAGAIMAMILAVLFQPLLGLVQRLVNQLIFGSGYDPSHTLRQYSTSINNILDLGLLANVMVKLIGEALGSGHGRLFLVDRKEEVFYLRDVGGVGDEQASQGTLSQDSPIADHLSQGQNPLTQYDVDLLPSFQASPEDERAWLSGLEAAVYVPIYLQGVWMGLLALGPKLSGDRYFDGDLVLLNTLADQTAVALGNARLVEDLVRTNNDLGQTYAALNKANQQLQELDKLKSSFIGVITHELRTPYANILFSLELLERHGRKHLPEELHDQLDQVTTGVKTAKSMIDNLVTFATFLSKQGELHPAQLDFGQVVRDSLLPLQTLAEGKQIALDIYVPKDLPSLRGDQDRLSDAMYHLVHNAIKFTEAGGKIWIRCQPEDRTIRFEVQDTGVGVPAGELPTLWEGFAQMADPLRRGVEGLGLGLALVKYVVNAHSGDVWAESEQGVGSTFGFYVPLV